MDCDCLTWDEHLTRGCKGRAVAAPKARLDRDGRAEAVYRTRLAVARLYCRVVGGRRAAVVRSC